MNFFVQVNRKLAEVITVINAVAAVLIVLGSVAFFISIFDDDAADMIIGLVVGVIVGGIMAVFICGMLAILIDIRERLAELSNKES